MLSLLEYKEPLFSVPCGSIIAVVVKTLWHALLTGTKNVASWLKLVVRI